MSRDTITFFKKILCITMLLLVTTAFIPTETTWAASKKPAKPKVTVSVTAKTVTISWKKAKKAKKYQIFRATKKNGKYKRIKTTKALSFKNTGLTTGKMYFYKVRSISGKRKSSFTKVAATPLAVPVCKSSSLMSCNRVRTNSVAGATGYVFYRSTSPNSGYTYLGTTSSLFFDDWNATIGATYYYIVRAYKKGSGYTTYSSYSAAGRGTRLLAVPSITEPILVENPDDVSKNAVQIAWTSVAGARGYELYRSSDEGESYQRIYRGSGNSYIDKNINAEDNNALKDGHTYYYKVRAYHTVFGGIEAYSYASPSKHSREKLIRQAQSWLGFDEKRNGKFKTIVDVYNGYKPLARDVMGGYNEAWCTTFVTASAIKADLVDIMPRERICRYMIDLYQEMGLWVENDAYEPKPGDLILFDWEDNGRGDCTGAPNHIGIVTAVKDGKITDIEGNNNDKYGHPVSYRTVSVNSRYIRGFMTPRFDVENGILFELNRVMENPEEEIVQDAEIVEEQVVEEPMNEGTDAVQQEPENEIINNNDEGVDSDLTI